MMYFRESKTDNEHLNPTPMKQIYLLHALRHHLLPLALAALLTLCGAKAQAQQAITSATGRWVGTWATAPQPCTQRQMPYSANLSGKTIRQVIKVSIGGKLLRLRLTNEYGNGPVSVKSVYIADSRDSCDIVASTARYLKFGNSHEVSIPAGKSVTSDALAYELKPLQCLTITINYAQSPPSPTMHPGSRTTSYLMKGVCTPKGKFRAAEKRDHWYNLSAVEVYDNHSSAIAIIGNSITDGKGSTTNGQDRWPDVLSEFLHLKHKVTDQGVLNLGIGGNRVITSGGFGERAYKRFGRDILRQAGVKKVVIFEGVNDIGNAKGNSEQVTLQLIAAIEGMAREAKAKGLQVYLGTITPMEGSTYYTHFHEAARRYVNDWIRAQRGKVDGILDFDQLMRDPARPERLRANWQSDWLHPNAKGYKAMGVYAAEVLK